MLRPDRALSTAALTLAADQLTKQIVFANVAPGEEVNVLPGVTLTHTENTGIAFGMFAGRPWIVFSLMLLALAVLCWFYLRHRSRGGLWLATGLLLGGALGNALDRVLLGHVRDFITLPHFPSFNLADAAITVGVVVLALTIEPAQQPAREGEDADDGAE